MNGRLCYSLVHNGNQSSDNSRFKKDSFFIDLLTKLFFYSNYIHSIQERLFMKVGFVCSAKYLYIAQAPKIALLIVHSVHKS